jgi:hypothetical protein
MTKQSNAAPQRPADQTPARKTPVTEEAVQRVQGRTAAGNGGRQSDWTRRLQSTLDRQAAAMAPDPKRSGGGAAGQHGGKGSGRKKSA